MKQMIAGNDDNWLGTQGSFDNRRMHPLLFILNYLKTVHPVSSYGKFYS